MIPVHCTTKGTDRHSKVAVCVLSCFRPVRPCARLWSVAHQTLSMGFSRQEYGVGCYALLQGIFSTQGLNPHLLHPLHWQAGSLPPVPPGKPVIRYTFCQTHSSIPTVTPVKDPCSFPPRPGKGTRFLLLFPGDTAVVVQSPSRV